MDKESHPSFSYLAMDAYQKVGGFKTSSTDATNANRFIISIYQLSYMYVEKKHIYIYMYLYLSIYSFNLSYYSSIYSYIYIYTVLDC